jgi:hypothetical protein
MTGCIARVPPTKEMQIAARQGLQLQQEYGRGESKIRMERTKEIVNGEPLDEQDWRGIASFHARYYGDSPPQQQLTRPDGGPDARYIAALLSGGKAGQETAFNLIPKLNRN